jgi:hypothetical protein
MSAMFSPCGLYRYRLDREFLLPGPIIGFMLHNPSVAGAATDDATSRRGIGFARRWEAGRLVYLNAWAGIATKPEALWRMADPIGPENDRRILAALDEIRASGGFIVAAWGAVTPPAERRPEANRRLAQVAGMLAGHDVRALGLTGGGAPRHPLYVRNDSRPLPWRPA